LVIRVITVEEGSGFDNELEVVEGMQFDRGYLSPYFVNNQEAMTADLDNPYWPFVEFIQMGLPKVILTTHLAFVWPCDLIKGTITIDA
jgi:hypothetical protein